MPVQSRGVRKAPSSRAWQPTQCSSPEVPWAEEPGGLPSAGSHRVGPTQRLNSSHEAVSRAALLSAPEGFGGRDAFGGGCGLSPPSRASPLWRHREGRAGGSFSVLGTLWEASGRKDTRCSSGSREGPSRSERRSAPRPAGRQRLSGAAMVSGSERSHASRGGPALWGPPGSTFKACGCEGASLPAQTVKAPACTQESGVRSLGQEDPLEEGVAPQSRVPAWRIPWTEEPGGLQSTGLQSRTGSEGSCAAAG